MYSVELDWWVAVVNCELRSGKQGVQLYPVKLDWHEGTFHPLPPSALLDEPTVKTG